MAKIYYRRYKERIDRGEITVDQALKLAKTEVPAKWRDDVYEMLKGAKHGS